jgi:hypothetical protein
VGAWWGEIMNVTYYDFKLWLDFNVVGAWLNNVNSETDLTICNVWPNDQALLGATVCRVAHVRAVWEPVGSVVGFVVCVCLSDKTTCVYKNDGMTSLVYKKDFFCEQEWYDIFCVQEWWYYIFCVQLWWYDIFCVQEWWYDISCVQEWWYDIFCVQEWWCDISCVQEWDITSPVYKNDLFYIVQ